MPTQCMVLSIDGVPFDLLRKMIDRQVMLNLAHLAKSCPPRKMRSVQPTVSCVAWATYMTGKNPGKHGIYGFIDRKEDTYDMALPNAAMLDADNLWQILSQADKRVFGMNVPSTYPPRTVNGILIGGFLSPSIEKCAYPASVSGYLKSIDYRIDSDAMLARKDKRAMMDDLHITLEKRMTAMFHFLESDNWDFFHTHIMTTDRINHFLLQKALDNDPEFAPAFFDFYRKIDEHIGRLLNTLPVDTPLLIFSDHGFCPIKYEVQLSRWMIKQGWTTPAQQLQHPLSIDPSQSRAYCLIPGRIYINLKGREPHGIVPIDQYQYVREQLIEDLMALTDPVNNKPVIQKIMRREEIYWPDGNEGPTDMTPEQTALADGTFGKAADLIAIPHDGYDLKLGLAQPDVFVNTALEGMHTYDDAVMIARHVDLPEKNLEIMQVARSIMKCLNVEPPKDLDGIGNRTTPFFE